MATSKKPVAKTIKKTTPTKKAAPAKKAVPAKKVVASAPKKVAKSTPIKKAAKPVVAAKKKVVAKKVAVKVAKKVVNSSKSAPAKKVVAKKVVAKKVLAPKKIAAPAKKVVKPIAKPTPVKKAAIKKVVVPAKKVSTTKVEKVVKNVEAVTIKKAVSKKTTVTGKGKPIKTITKITAPVRPVTPISRPVVKEDAKPTVIVAHRKLESKTKQEEIINTPEEFKPKGKSILDPIPMNTNETTKRYSDDELLEFKELIVTRMETARRELTYLQGLITRKDEAGTDDTENRYMNMEDGSGAMEREQLAQMASRQIQFIGHLEKALMRIENKTYGICRVTGKLIDKARLRAVPHATLSIEAKNTINKG
ncbi:MAG TPA: TraR/DksA C4-type zinc finger protein [Flavipsychrobacter sp.]|nr:TraR/DksA C4-type zinc finger protein [Flavipsychrobacter sp.]